MSKINTPRATCTVTFAGEAIEYTCVDCGETKRHVLPAGLDVVLQRGTDFSNYHRWCGEKSVQRAPKGE
jgi:hypothetical protein